MAHGVAIDPAAGCGTSAAYVLDEGLCSTTQAAAFFGLIAGDGSATGPGATGTGGSGATSSGSAGKGTAGSGDGDP